MVLTAGGCFAETMFGMAAPSATHRRGSVARRCAAVILLAIAACAWAAFGVLLSTALAETGQAVRHVGYGRWASWWAVVSFFVAAPSSLALLTWLLSRAARRTSGRRRTAVFSGAVVVWLVSGTALLLVGGFAVLLVAVSPVLTPVSGSDGTVLVSRSALDGDGVQVWRQTGRFTYVPEPEPSTLDPKDGPCALHDTPSGAVVTCGGTSQRLSPAATS